MYVVRRRQDVMEVVDPVEDFRKPVLRGFTKILGRYSLIVGDLEQDGGPYEIRVLYQVLPLNLLLHLD